MDNLDSDKENMGQSKPSLDKAVINDIMKKAVREISDETEVRAIPKVEMESLLNKEAGSFVKDGFVCDVNNTGHENKPLSKLEIKLERDNVDSLISEEENSVVKAISIVQPVGINNYMLNLPELEKLLLDERCVGKKVSVVSIAGNYRKGKSFILNFFLRYLNGNKDGEVGENWMDVGEKVEGFSWRGGSERDTTGIMIWGEPFFLKDKNGEDVVVILMDTQGAFDNKSTVKDNATIFALSTMLASLQIFNISQNIQEDDLQHLQLFTEYGRLALADSDAKPFQALNFLVRDWSYPYEFEYGFNGGRRILKNRLDIDPCHHSSLQSLREHIQNCFEKLECFLMPHPGLTVSSNPNFTGKLDEMEKEFRMNLQTFVEHTFDQNNLVPKSINGCDLTCGDLFEYFKSYVTIFQGEELPEPKSMLLATAEANNYAAVCHAKHLYIKAMEELCGGGKPYMQSAELEKRHEMIRESALESFKNAKKMGGLEYSNNFLSNLENDLEEQWASFVKNNASKNLFKSMKTPTVLVATLIVMYVLHELAQIIGLELFASLLSTLLLSTIITICAWTYIRYSGKFIEIGQLIDDGVLWLWVNFLSPMSKQGISSATQFTVKLNTNSMTSVHNKNE
uniref:GB1/RHD3-type G domain-containing protein n=2 Tax=Rhabditophanes sp. KR3021 TaxID=114890 RepID=A0AC35TT98_9BILA